MNTRLLSFMMVLCLMPTATRSSVEGFKMRTVVSKKEIISEIKKEAKALGLDPRLALAVARVESHLNPDAIRADKKSYSVGVYQLMLPTAKDLGFNGGIEELKDYKTNIRLGISYLKKCEEKYESVERVACCYNAGLYAEDSVCESKGVSFYQSKVLKKLNRI